VLYRSLVGIIADNSAFESKRVDIARDWFKLAGVAV
jgi:hypothetical protein